MRLAALAIAASIATNGPSLLGQSPTLVDEDAYAVYASSVRVAAGDVPVVALLAHTRADQHCDSAIPPGWEDVAAAHRQANLEQRAVLDGFDLGRPYRLVSPADLEAAETASLDYVNRHLGDRVPPAPWPFAAFPARKVFIVSAVGFSTDRTRAMFMLQQSGGFDDHRGVQVLRVKVAGQWIDPPGISRCMWLT